jgi:hypothetical protein
MQNVSKPENAHADTSVAVDLHIMINDAGVETKHSATSALETCSTAEQDMAMLSWHAAFAHS